MRYFQQLCIVGFIVFFANPCNAAIGTATIKGTVKDSTVVGMMSFMETAEGLQVEVSVANVSEGKHGVHIHEKGDCSDEGRAAGGHYNPTNAKHGFMPEEGHEHSHAGDMGNVEVASDGTGTLSVFLPGVYLIGREPSVAGLSVILHEKEDDFSQPTGNAGGRIGCGIIMVEDQNRATADSQADSGGQEG